MLDDYDNYTSEQKIKGVVSGPMTSLHLTSPIIPSHRHYCMILTDSPYGSTIPGRDEERFPEDQRKEEERRRAESTEA